MAFLAQSFDMANFGPHFAVSFLRVYAFKGVSREWAFPKMSVRFEGVRIAATPANQISGIQMHFDL